MRHRGTPGRVLLTLVILSAVMIPVTGLSNPVPAQAGAGLSSIESPPHASLHSAEHGSARFHHSSLRQRFFRFFRNLGRSVKEISPSQVSKWTKKVPEKQPLVLTTGRSRDRQPTLYVIYKLADVDYPSTAVVTKVEPDKESPVIEETILDVNSLGVWSNFQNKLAARHSKLYATRNLSAIFELTRQQVMVPLPLDKAIELAATAPVGAKVIIGSVVLHRTGKYTLTVTTTRHVYANGTSEKTSQEITFPSRGLFTSPLRNAQNQIRKALEPLFRDLRANSDKTYPVALVPKADQATAQRAPENETSQHPPIRPTPQIPRKHEQPQTTNLTNHIEPDHIKNIQREHEQREHIEFIQKLARQTQKERKVVTLLTTQPHEPTLSDLQEIVDKATDAYRLVPIGNEVMMGIGPDGNYTFNPDNIEQVREAIKFLNWPSGIRLYRIRTSVPQVEYANVSGRMVTTIRR